MLLVGKKGENGLSIGLTLRRAWVPMSDQVLWVVDRNPEWSGPSKKEN